MKKISIDRSKCIGCFRCKQICYSVFEVGSDGKAKVRSGISDGDIEDAVTAATNCPVGAISIIDILTGGAKYDPKQDTSFWGTVNKILDWADSSSSDE